MKSEENKKDLKLIIFEDDDDKVKEKYAYITEDDFWVCIKLFSLEDKKIYGEKFKVPRERVRKIKEVRI